MSISFDPQQLPENEQLSCLKACIKETISHKFLAPLAIVELSTQLLAYFGDTWDRETQIQHLRRIQEAVEYMNQMLDECLDPSGNPDEEKGDTHFIR